MANKTGLLPPSDLLQRLEGIEAGLRKNKKVGLAGWLGLVPSATGLAAALLEGDQALDGAAHPLLVGALGILTATFLFLVGRSRLWRAESRQPFRYTCAVRRFEPLGALALNEFKELSEWVEYDLSEKLNERIGRLSFFDAPRPGDDSKTDPAAFLDDDASHVDVTGQYLVRERHQRGEERYKRVIEVTPRVRIGGSRSAATLGHPVKFTVRLPPGHGAETVETGRSAERKGNAGTAPGQMELDDYDKLIERVYFSVATDIYRQIRKDVQGKIHILPTRFLRATAYFHEAEDYAHSNTLDAYDEARELYESAMRMYDPRLRPAPPRKLFRPLLWLLQAKTALTWRVRRVMANFFPRLGLPEVMAARSEIGYASTLLYRRLLAGMSGHRVNPTYEARPVICRAVDRLRNLPRDVPGRQEALFHAHVTAALSWWSLDAIPNARKSLREARRVFPSGFGGDSRYLYAAGLIDPRLVSSVPLLTHAVEQDPRFEIAQFQLAVRTEMMWRRGSTLERTAANRVFEEYESVLKLDPGNIRAWGNLGYMRWLLGERDEARLAFERGREYKQIQRGTDIGSLDYGLARVAAEQDRLDEAYSYYQSAVAAQVTQAVSDAKVMSSQFYFFDYIGDAMLERFERFCNTVVHKCDERKAEEVSSGGANRATEGAAEERPSEGSLTPQMFDSVAAHALNDYGEACHTYYIRNADRAASDTARRCYEEAVRRDHKFVIPRYNLYLLNRYEGSIDSATECIEQVEDLEPSWPEAILAKLFIRTEWASEQTWRKPVLPGSEGRRVRRKQELAFELPEDVKERAHLGELDEDVKTKAEELVPHDWLWKSNDGGVEFDWRAVYRRGLERTLRWEREMDDLHVRSLFMWDIANLFTHERGPLLARTLGRASRSDRREEYAASAPVMLLRQIKEHFWPSDLRVLLIWRQLYVDGDAEDAIRELIRHWLGQDATSWWALKLMVTDVLDFRAEEITFFSRVEKRKHLRKALEQLDLSPKAPNGSPGRAEVCMREWIESQLERLTASAA